MKDAEVNSVRLVREIRDLHYEQLKSGSWEETVQFFRHEAEEANKEAEQLLHSACRVASDRP